MAACDQPWWKSCHYIHPPISHVLIIKKAYGAATNQEAVNKQKQRQRQKAERGANHEVKAEEREENESGKGTK